ncbi:hypothetical protein JCM8547_000170 [Rhodosporidiobolus lusitaniae]
MFHAPLRTVSRALPVRALPQLRAATTSTAQRRFAVYQSQKTKPMVYASLGLVALFGWTAAILTVGGKGSKKEKDSAKKGALISPSSGLRGLGRRSFGRRQPLSKILAILAATNELLYSAPEPAPPSDSSSPPPDNAYDNASATSSSAPDASAQSAAFNPETGEINWDCPCLGGMADGPCGEEFKAAFSCFVYSEAEPKGIDCVEKFRGMQECFRKHPDIYGDEAEDLEVEEEDEGFALATRAEAALALPDEHFLGEVAKEAPAHR